MSPELKYRVVVLNELDAGVIADACNRQGAEGYRLVTAHQAGGRTTLYFEYRQ